LSHLKEIAERILNRKLKLKDSLDSLIEQLKEFGALKIYIFGSYIRDDFDVNSDLDLLVIMPSNKAGMEWINLIYNKIEMKIHSDLIIFNSEEFKDQLPSNSFLENILSSGRLVYEKT
jgi:predicted nucleotidyltransferase